MTLKLVDVIKRFKGENGEDIDLWLERYETAVRISLPTASTQADVEKQMVQIMPLFLEGPAYRTWKQLDSAGREDLPTVKASLKRVYGDSKIIAWEKLKQSQLLPGENVDVLADQVKNFLSVIVNGKPPEELVSLFLVDALPSRVAEKVRIEHGETMETDKIVSCAKALLLSYEDSRLSAVGVSRQNVVKRSANNWNGSQPRCTGCQRSGHTVESCRVVCHGCGGRGHIRRLCKKQVSSGNGSAGMAAAEPVMPAREFQSANIQSMGGGDQY